MARKQAESTGAPSVGMYKRLAYGFFGVTLLFIVVLIVVTYWTATITIVPARVPAETTFRVVVAKGGDAVNGTTVPGAMDTAVVTAKATVTLTATERKEGKARGTVTITNTTSRAQPLIATTRLVTAEGILFRLESGVTAPAKGSVVARVIADAPGAAGDIGPSRFTIPGLAEALQSVIYAESKEPMKGGLTMLGVATAKDIQGAIAAAEAAAIEKFTREHPREPGVTVFDRHELVRASADAKDGDRRDSIEANAEVRFTRVRVPTEHLETVANAKLQESVGSRVSLAALPPTITPTLDAVDVTQGRAMLTVHAVGYSALEATSPALDPAQFVGTSRRAIEDAFHATPGVASVRVQFRPFFIPRAPFLKDHIRVIISK